MITTLIAAAIPPPHLRWDQTPSSYSNLYISEMISTSLVYAAEQKHEYFISKRSFYPPAHWQDSDAWSSIKGKDLYLHV